MSHDSQTGYNQISIPLYKYLILVVRVTPRNRSSQQIQTQVNKLTSQTSQQHTIQQWFPNQGLWIPRGPQEGSRGSTTSDCGNFRTKFILF